MKKTSARRFNICVNGRKRYFDTLIKAERFASAYFKQKGIILGIEEMGKKNV